MYNALIINRIKKIKAIFKKNMNREKERNREIERRKLFQGLASYVQHQLPEHFIYLINA